MAKDKNNKELNSRGGMLSGADIRKRIIHKDDIDKYLELFEKRDWNGIEKLKLKQPNGSEVEGLGWEKRFVITNYNELNVTPFSYDLSLGEEVFSIQKPEQKVSEVNVVEGYSLEPGETVVVITRELIAIPHAYSATVWPSVSLQDST